MGVGPQLVVNLILYDFVLVVAGVVVVAAAVVAVSIAAVFPAESCGFDLAAERAAKAVDCWRAVPVAAVAVGTLATRCLMEAHK